MMSNNYTTAELYHAFMTTYPECVPEEIDYMVEQWKLKYDADEGYLYGEQ